MSTDSNPAESNYPAKWWHSVGDDRIKCDLCPRDCLLGEGQRGLCFVRKCEGQKMILTTYGRSSGFCIDPIEKKPLNHFYPGSRVLSFGTAGCNLSCKFCQNWDISKSRNTDRLTEKAMPEAIALSAKNNGCKSVAFTYNDPTIFAEYAIDTADACHALGVKTIAVTAGYIHEEPMKAFYDKIDAANVDLKSFSDDFYWKVTSSHLEPVKRTLKYLVHETNVWTEITTLIIPTLNDSDDEISRLCDWVASYLSPSVPLHFSAFHPDYRMADLPATPITTLRRAYQLAKAAGLQHVYLGNVHDLQTDTTYCPNCKEAVIERDWYNILSYKLDETGRCLNCSRLLDGCFEAFAGAFGARRIPLRIIPP